MGLLGQVFFDMGLLLAEISLIFYFLRSRKRRDLVFAILFIPCALLLAVPPTLAAERDQAVHGLTLAMNIGFFMSWVIILITNVFMWLGNKKRSMRE